MSSKTLFLIALKIVFIFTFKAVFLTDLKTIFHVPNPHQPEAAIYLAVMPVVYGASMLRQILCVSQLPWAAPA